MTFRSTEKNKNKKTKIKARSKKVISAPLSAHHRKIPMHPGKHTINETHHDIVSLHLSFLTGQFLTLHFQTVRQKENVMLEYDQEHCNPHICADAHI